MVRHYVRKKEPRPYSNDDLQEAFRRVKAGEPCRRIARLFLIPHTTLRDYVSKPQFTPTVRHRTVLFPEEELIIAQHVATFSDCGYIFYPKDLRLFVKSFLDKAGRTSTFFKNNLPSDDWVSLFVERHANLLSTRMYQRDGRKKAAVSEETVNRYFDNLEKTLKEVPPENILNYDEVILTDDPKAKELVFRKSSKYPKSVKNTSMSSFSLMFACAANGVFLPSYVVYEAEHLMDSWVLGGPISTKYARTKSGWFDSYCFKDWLESIAVPYFSRLSNNAPRVLIGDNLSSHVSADVVDICERNKIQMFFFPPNSTHLLQPLDVAVYAPVRVAWRKLLGEWKREEGEFYTTLPKIHFPRLLSALMQNLDDKEEHAISGFKATGIYPLDRHKVLCKLTQVDIQWVPCYAQTPYDQEVDPEFTQKLVSTSSDADDELKPVEDSSENPLTYPNVKSEPEMEYRSHSCDSAEFMDVGECSNIPIEVKIEPDDFTISDGDMKKEINGFTFSYNEIKTEDDDFTAIDVALEEKHNDIGNFEFVNVDQFTGEKELDMSLCVRSNIKTEVKDVTVDRSEIENIESDCSVCGESFNSNDDLNKHMVAHKRERPIGCSLCSESFLDSSSLSQHRQKYHRGGRAILCYTCGKAFTSKSNLASHMIKHTEENSYSCVFCEKSFTNSSNLARHMKYHEVGKSFVCQTCERAFDRKDMLVSHMKTHTGEKPHICNVCGKSFSAKVNLSKHKRSHTGEKPFACSECEKSFADKCNLVAHMRIHTGVKPYSCNICGKSFTFSSGLKGHKNVHSG